MAESIKNQEIGEQVECWKVEAGRRKMEARCWYPGMESPGTRTSGASQKTRSPGGARAQYIDRLAWTCRLNRQIECGIDRYVGRVVYPDWYVESIDM